MPPSGRVYTITGFGKVYKPVSQHTQIVSQTPLLKWFCELQIKSLKLVFGNFRGSKHISAASCFEELEFIFPTEPIFRPPGITKLYDFFLTENLKSRAFY